MDKIFGMVQNECLLLVPPIRASVPQSVKWVGAGYMASFQILAKARFFSSTPHPDKFLGSTQDFIQWVLIALFAGL
jgi:hypothetical protein